MPGIDFALTTVGWSSPYVEKLRDVLGAREFVHTRDAAEIDRCLKVADVAILGGDLDARFLKAPRLRWIHCDHAGLEKSARPEVFEKGLLVTSSAGRSAPVLAEHAVLFMLVFAFQFTKFLEAQRAHKWGFPGQDQLRGLYGHTVGILGLGNTGRELAVRCQALGTRVLGYRRQAGEVPGVDRLYSAERGETIEPLLRESDYLALALPLSDQTWHIIGAEQLGLLKPTAVIVNMGRGGLIDEQALIATLREGRIAGAGLDTFEQEPLSPDSPLWDLPNVLITPHTTPQVPDRTGRSFEIIAENARRYRQGETELVNLLRPSDVYSHGR